MKNKKLTLICSIGLILVLLASLVLAACAKEEAPAPAPTTTLAPARVIQWDFNTHTTNVLWTGKELEKLTREVLERTNGGLNIVIHWGSELYKGDEILRVLRDGLLPCSDISVFVFGDEHALGYQFLPFLVNMQQQPFVDDYVMEKVMASVLEEKWNTKVLGNWYAYAGQLGTKEPVTKLADLNGLRIRVSSREMGAAFETVGATPVVIGAFADTLSAIQTGVVDGVLYGWAGFIDWKVGDLCPYLVPLDMAPTPFRFGVNKDAFLALPEEYQEILIDVCRKFDAIGPGVQAQEEARLIAAAKKNYNVTEFSPAEMKDMRDRAKPLWEEWAQHDSLSKRAFETTLEALEKYGE